MKSLLEAIWVSLKVNPLQPKLEITSISVDTYITALWQNWTRGTWSVFQISNPQKFQENKCLLFCITELCSNLLCTNRWSLIHVFSRTSWSFESFYLLWPSVSMDRLGQLYCAISHKKLECLQILVSEKVLEATPHQYWEKTLL